MSGKFNTDLTAWRPRLGTWTFRGVPFGDVSSGRGPWQRLRAIAVVATIGYGGFLLGAPLIGFLAHMMPLDRALLAVALLVLLIAVLAPAARERGTGRSQG